MEQFKGIVYVDMDGVIADFDRGFYELTGITTDNVSDEELWSRINAYGRVKFFSGLPWMSGGKEMWNFIVNNFPTVKILSALGKSDKIDGQTTQGKTEWLRHNIPSLSSNDIILVANKHRKRHYSKPGDIIIDDTPVVIQEWLKKGGAGILHKTANETINQLKRHMTNKNEQVDEVFQSMWKKLMNRKSHKNKNISSHSLAQTSPVTNTQTQKRGGKSTPQARQLPLPLRIQKPDTNFYNPPFYKNPKKWFEDNFVVDGADYYYMGIDLTEYGFSAIHGNKSITPGEKMEYPLQFLSDLTSYMNLWNECMKKKILDDWETKNKMTKEKRLRAKFNVDMNEVTSIIEELVTEELSGINELSPQLLMKAKTAAVGRDDSRHTNLTKKINSSLSKKTQIKYYVNDREFPVFIKGLEKIVDDTNQGGHNRNYLLKGLEYILTVSTGREDLQLALGYPTHKVFLIGNGQIQSATVEFDRPSALLVTGLLNKSFGGQLKATDLPMRRATVSKPANEGVGYVHDKDMKKDSKHISGERWRVKFQSAGDLKKHGNTEMSPVNEGISRQDLKDMIKELVSEMWGSRDDVNGDETHDETGV